MRNLNKEEYLSIPNLMGYFRIVLIPLFCVFYLKQAYGMAAGIVLISMATDFLDGKIARRFHMITEFGKFLDPLADKLTHGAIAVCLAIRFQPMRYLLVLMILKEGFMVVMGIVNLRHHRKLDGAKWFGKVCTGSLFFLLCFLVLFPGLPLKVISGLTYLEMGIMTVTMVLYMREFKKMATVQSHTDTFVMGSELVIENEKTWDGKEQKKDEKDTVAGR